MARRWVWGLLIATGIGFAGIASLPALIEWQGTRLIRESLSPTAHLDVVRLGLSGGTFRITEEGADGGRLGLIDLAYSLGNGVSARLDLDMPVAGMLPDGVEAPDAVLKTAGAVEPLGGWRWRFIPDGCVTLTAKRIVLGEATITRPESLCLKPVPSRDFLVFDLAEGWHAAVQARSVSLTAETSGGEIVGSLPEATVEAALTTAGDLTALDANWRKAKLNLPGQGIAGDGFSGNLSIDGSADRHLKADYAVATIGSAHDPAFFSPLKLSGTAEGSLDREIAFDAALTDRSAKLSMALRGRHDLSTGAGQAGLRMKPTLFGAEAAKFTTLFPVARQWISEFSGTIGVKARTAWGPGADRGKAEILLKDLASMLAP